MWGFAYLLQPHHWLFFLPLAAERKKDRKTYDCLEDNFNEKSQDLLDVNQIMSISCNCCDCGATLFRIQSTSYFIENLQLKTKQNIQITGISVNSGRCDSYK